MRIRIARGLKTSTAAVVSLLLASHALAGDDNSPSPLTISASEIRAAAARGLASLDRSAARYAEHRACFSCHHQTLPLVAQHAAEQSGYPIDSSLRSSQLALALKSFAQRNDQMRAGHGIGGRAMTVSYGLWALRQANHAADATSEAMVAYLLKTQQPDGHWVGQTARPPLEESYQTCTVLAMMGLERFASSEQRDAARAATIRARAWLRVAPAKTLEDQVARLWGLVQFDPDNAADRAMALELVLARQRDDGGWAQIDELESDAYATGMTLYVLRAVGTRPDDTAYRRGVQFLVKSQRDDGAWLVESRSKPIQPYYDFDDEDPLRKDQFISVAASGWAVAALAAAERASD